MQHSSDMSRFRKALVQLGLVILLAGSFFDMITGREHWPFSPYSMFSEVELDTATTRMQLYGVPEAPGRPEEVPLLEEQYLRPFSFVRLHTAFRKMQGRPQSDSLLRVGVRDVAQRYERLRQAGRHDGPPLRSLRLYAAHWRILPDARNAAQPPDRRILVTEVPIEP